MGFLALLWIFVLVAFGIVRSDLFGARTPGRRPARPPQAEDRQAAQAQEQGAPQAGRHAGALVGTSIGLGDAPITIGRGNDSTLVLTDDYASNRHARLFPQDGQWLVEDLGSTNGTYLDRAKVTGPTPVAHRRADPDRQDRDRAAAVTMSLTLRFAARSDVGLLRADNEDAVYAGPRLLAVADGMGGHAAGDVASAVAIAALAPLDDDVPPPTCSAP